MAREDAAGTKRLVAYVVAPQAALGSERVARAPEGEAARLHGAGGLRVLDELPLTANGKIDRKALPAPEPQRPDLAGRLRRTADGGGAERSPQSGPRCLRVEQVGVHDNFFELGGDSILSIQVISLARREGLKLTPKLLFAHQTIAELAPS